MNHIVLIRQKETYTFIWQEFLFPDNNIWRQNIMGNLISVAGLFRWPLLTPHTLQLTHHIKNVAKILSKWRRFSWRFFKEMEERIISPSMWPTLIQFCLSSLCPCSRGLFSSPPSAKFSFPPLPPFTNSSPASKNSLYWPKQFSSCLSMPTSLSKAKAQGGPKWCPTEMPPACFRDISLHLASKEILNHHFE